MIDNQITELLDLAHHAWSIAVCAMHGMPIPASWGNAVEKGLRERGIDVDELPYVVPDAMLEGRELTAEQVKQIHDVIEKHWHDLPAEYDMPEATALPEYSYDWQAIVDELNAMLGSDAE